MYKNLVNCATKTMKNIKYGKNINIFANNQN